MKIRDVKLKMVLDDYHKANSLLNLCNKIETELNYNLNFDYSKVNLINLHSILENTFSFNTCFSTIVCISLFSQSYKELNKLIDYLENVIKIYGVYVKDQELKQQIKKLGLNTNSDKSEFFLLLNLE